MLSEGTVTGTVALKLVVGIVEVDTVEHSRSQPTSDGKEAIVGLTESLRLPEEAAEVVEARARTGEHTRQEEERSCLA